jgi:anti-sigma B factor antagonist
MFYCPVRKSFSAADLARLGRAIKRLSHNCHANLLLLSESKGLPMKFIISDETGTTAKIGLTGKLDIVGAEVIALPLATLAGGKKGLVVDLSGVTFLASIGIRHLVSATKALSRKGGKLVLLNPTDAVKDVLVTSGVIDLMPIVATESAAYELIG